MDCYTLEYSSPWMGIWPGKNDIYVYLCSGIDNNVIIVLVIVIFCTFSNHKPNKGQLKNLIKFMGRIVLFILHPDSHLFVQCFNAKWVTLTSWVKVLYKSPM